MNIKVSLTKESDAFIKSLGNFKRNFLTELIQAADTIGNILVMGSRATIDAQGFKALDERYKAWKGTKGYDTRILLMTHDMYNAIRYKRMASTLALIQGQIGFKDGQMHNHFSSYAWHPNRDKVTNRTKKGRFSPWSPGAKKGSTSIGMAYLAGLLEGGTSRMPARPFFKPTAEQHRKDVYEQFYAAFLRAWGGFIAL
jgi:hypothetical protein